MLHENEAAAVLKDICQGENLTASEPKEGKIELKAQCDGLLLIDTTRLNAINSLGEMMIATRQWRLYGPRWRCCSGDARHSAGH